MSDGKYTVTRLETMLKVWEQILFVANAETKLMCPEFFRGAIANWHRFRKTVLDRTAPFQKEDFEMPIELFTSYFVEVFSYDFFPQIFANWSRSSRRVYSLSKDMQIDLELTSVSGVTWNDLHPPFPSFVISLPIPIPGLFDNLIDTLVVEIGKGYIRIITLGNELDVFKAMPKEMKNGIASASRNGNLQKLLARCKLAREGGYCYIPSNQYAERLCGDLSLEITPDKIDVEKVEFTGIENHSEEKQQQSLRFWTPIYRIVIGLCMHLDDLQQKNVGVSVTPVDVTPTEIPVTEDPKAITSTDNLVTLDCEHELTEDERRIHGIIREKGSIEALRELSASFRSAHRRRPPGQGDNPDARKSVKVRWTIVNEKRLSKSSLPAGCVVEVA